MKRVIMYVILFLLAYPAVTAQETGQLLRQSRRLLNEFDQDLTLDSTIVRDTVPHMIPMLLPAELFIPADRLIGVTPWISAPMTRPVVHVIPEDGLTGLLAAGAFSQAHPDKFFSTLNGNNVIDIPQLFLSRQQFVGNTLRLGKRIYLVNGILYGAQIGVRGNNWGMGTREGILWRPGDMFTLLFWNQYYQSVSVYTPVLFPTPDGDMAAILMPATPEVFSLGVQASFVAGEFIIGIGVSVSPVPFQKRRHSELRYR